MIYKFLTIVLVSQTTSIGPSIDESMTVAFAPSHHLRPAYVTKVTEDMLRRTPSWLTKDDNPPLSAREAIAAAERAKGILNIKPSSRELEFESAELVSGEDRANDISNRWFWIINYRDVAFHRKGIQKTALLPVVVLMDGTIAKTEHEPEAVEGNRPFDQIVDDANGVQFASYGLSQAMIFDVNHELLRKTPHWVDEGINPLVSARKAIYLSKIGLREFYQGADEYALAHGIDTLTLHFDLQSLRWYWVVGYRLPQLERRYDLTYIPVVVFMDGSVLKPSRHENRGRISPYLFWEKEKTSETSDIFGERPASAP